MKVLSFLIFMLVLFIGWQQIQINELKSAQTKQIGLTQETKELLENYKKLSDLLDENTQNNLSTSKVAAIALEKVDYLQNEFVINSAKVIRLFLNSEEVTGVYKNLMNKFDRFLKIYVENSSRTYKEIESNYSKE
jgi:hypothetical protein